MRPRASLALLLTILLLSAVSLACGLTSLVEDTNEGGQADTAVEVQVEERPTLAPRPADTNVAANQPTVDVADLEARLIQLYELVNPSVVHILVYRSQNDQFPLGSGSGFVYDSQGHITTNNHVVQDGNVFEVVFADGSRRLADVVGLDVDSDLAVIKVDNLPEGAVPVTLGSSDNVRVGQLVIAIGNPFGEQGSMSLGIVSGLGRSLESQRQLENSLGRFSLPEVVQTDAPINPGNSGGPLLNLRGEVVGVNSAIRSTTGVNSGVGFSIPVDAVARIVPKLIEDGEYVYSYMGIQIQSLNLNLQEQFDLPQLGGAYVTGVTEGGPADDAGLIAADASGRGGDLIIAIDGEPIQDTEQLIAYLVFKTQVGQTIDLTVIRDGETITVPLTLGARP